MRYVLLIALSVGGRTVFAPTKNNIIDNGGNKMCTAATYKTNDFLLWKNS